AIDRRFRPRVQDHAVNRIARSRLGALTLVALASCRAQPIITTGQADRNFSPPPAPGDSIAIPEAVDSLLGLGEQVYLRGEFDSASALWTAALKRSRTLRDSVAEARSLTWLGLSAWRRGDYSAAHRFGEAALELKLRWSLKTDLF